MKHIFILNPAAGKHKKALDLIPHIEEYFQKNPGDLEAKMWIDCILNDTQPLVLPEQAYAVTQILEGKSYDLLDNALVKKAYLGGE